MYFLPILNLNTWIVIDWFLRFNVSLLLQNVIIYPSSNAERQSLCVLNIIQWTGTRSHHSQGEGGDDDRIFRCWMLHIGFVQTWGGNCYVFIKQYILWITNVRSTLLIPIGNRLTTFSLAFFVFASERFMTKYGVFVFIINSIYNRKLLQYQNN